MRWVAEKQFDGKTANFYVSAADGVKEGGVGRGVESTRDAGSEGGVLRFEMGGTVGLMERAVVGGEQVGEMCGVGCGVATHSR